MIKFAWDEKNLGSVFFGGILLLIVLLLLFLIKPILKALVLTIVLTYILSPVMRLILPVLKKRSLAVVFAFFFILVPFFLLTIFLIIALSGEISEFSSIPAVKELIGLTGENIKNNIAAPSVQTLSFPIIKGWLGGFIEVFGFVGGFLLQVFLALFLTAYVLYLEEDLIEYLRGIKNPRVWDFILFMDEGLKHLVYSMLLSSLVSGVLATMIYVLFGVPGSFILGVVTGIVDLIPIIGPWLVYFSLTLYFIAEGKILLSLVFLVVSIVFISAIPELILRPFLVGRAEHINYGILLAAFVAGGLAFGPVGIILGPIIIIALIGSVRIFLFEEVNIHDHKSD
jgi:predicted PurR-regulated permease PerM